MKGRKLLDTVQGQYAAVARSGLSNNIALKQSLPPAVAADVQAHVGCIAGAIPIADYQRLLRDAGIEAGVVRNRG